TLGGNARGITIQYSLEEVNLNIDLAIPCGLIITELVSNAIKHAFNEIKDEKKILITLERNEKIKISVKDNGSGLPDDTGIDNSESLGLVLVPMLAKQINGDIRVLNNSGTEFILTFPDV
nr:sensor histidine kinase [Spirochaetota bacterium]